VCSRAQAVVLPGAEAPDLVGRLYGTAEAVPSRVERTDVGYGALPLDVALTGTLELPGPDATYLLTVPFTV